MTEIEKKNRIMEFSFKKFTTMGITHVTMDEISRGVGIGKGTLYKYFPSKEALLIGTIEFIAVRIEKKINEIMENEQLSPVDQLSLILKTIGEHLAKINPSVFAYLERTQPEAYKKIIEFRTHIILTYMIKIFEEGKKSGLLEPDTDCFMIVQILISAANEKILSTLDYSMDKLFHTIITIILKGCLTETGRKQIFNK